MLARIAEVPLVAHLPAWAARYALLNPMRWAVGGTILAAQRALEAGLAVNLGGGFHHAHGDRGHGLCVLSDIAIAIAALRARQLARRFLIIDLDAHQGDGLEAIFMDDSAVQIFDMYNVHVFPADEAARSGISWEVRLDAGTRDEEYRWHLTSTLPTAIEQSHPDLVFYFAGTDIVRDDPVGLLDVSPEGVLRRDQLVLDALNECDLPTVMVTAGGYTSQSAQLIAATIEYWLRR